MLEQWHRWIEAFDETCKDNRWERLAPFVTEDVIYVVCGSPFAAELRGRDAVLSGFERSVRNFDQKFDRRSWTAVNVRVHEPNLITATVDGGYAAEGLPELRFGVFGQWMFRGGSISMMIDHYDLTCADMVRAMEWLGVHGAGLDPSYA